jgi:hypothetical protein
MSWVRLIGMLAAIPCLAAAAEADTISDQQLVGYAHTPFDRAAKMLKRDVLGVHHGVRVVADFPCSDVCPDYTVRVIHYDVAPGPECAAIGGAEVVRRVPVSIAVVEKTFCVPKILADSGH